MRRIEKLYQLGKTVFSINDLRVIWQESNANALKSGVKYLVDTGRLIRLRKGIYALSAKYNHLELAQKLIMPSYISLDTALQKSGVIFQTTQNITSLARYSRTILVSEETYEYHAVKDNILLNPLGIVQKEYYFMASPERAIGDWLYLRGEAYFDNLRPLDKELLSQIVEIYPQKKVQKRINKLIATL